LIYALWYEAPAVTKKIKVVVTRVLEASPFFLWKFAELLGGLLRQGLETPITFFFGTVTSILGLTS